MVKVDRPVQIPHFEEDLFEPDEPHVMPPSANIPDSETLRQPSTTPAFSQPQARSAVWSPPLGMAGGSLADLNYGRLVRSSASSAARCVACHGVCSHPVPAALVGRGCLSCNF